MPLFQPAMCPSEPVLLYHLWSLESEPKFLASVSKAFGARLRFFFHIEGEAPLRDRHGIDLPDVSAAHTEAVNYAMNLSGLRLGLSGRSSGGIVIVTDHEGRKILTVPRFLRKMNELDFFRRSDRNRCRIGAQPDPAP